MLNRSAYARIGQNDLIYGPTLNILIHMRQQAPTNTRGYLVRINHKSLTNCITYGPATTGTINMLIKITRHQLFKCPLHSLDKLNPFISLFHRFIVAILITKLTKRSAIFVITVVVYWIQPRSPLGSLTVPCRSRRKPYSSKKRRLVSWSISINAG